MSANVSFILTAAFGAFCQELLYWFELRNKIDPNTFSLFRSSYYWVITVLMIVVSGLGTYLIFSEQVPTQKGVQFILGAAFPLIFKKLVKATLNNNKPDTETSTVEKNLTKKTSRKFPANKSVIRNKAAFKQAIMAYIG